jgi:pimeloyl-ACP methyl ester carboxylesterase
MRINQLIRSIFTWLGRTLLALLILIVLLVSASLVARAKAQNDFAKAYPPIGQMVDVGRYSLHIQCLGESQNGEPTIVIDAGSGSVGLMWTLVQSEVARSARVCTYDRAGLGWSETSIEPRAASAIVEELHTLLVNAKVEGPYVLVGHSLGGIFVRLYQNKYPDEVSGLILVDSADGELDKYMSGTNYMQTMHQFIGVSRTLSQTGLIKVYTGATALFSGPHSGYEALPEHVTQMIQAMDVKTTEGGAAEVAALPAIWEESRSRKTHLGNLPLTVIVHGYCDSCSKDELELEKEEKGWLELQKHLASLSTNGRLIQADPETGHNIQIDQPQIIVDAIHAMLEQTQQTRPR